MLGHQKRIQDHRVHSYYGARDATPHSQTRLGFTRYLASRPARYEGSILLHTKLAASRPRAVNARAHLLLSGDRLKKDATPSQARLFCLKQHRFAVNSRLIHQSPDGDSRRSQFPNGSESAISSQQIGISTTGTRT